MPRIPDSFIDELLTRVDIVSVIDRRLPLKKAGREYQALCPFHDEKTPSFTVSPQKQFYHCFGCGAHGTAIGFLLNYDGLDFPTAVEELAAGVGLKVPREFSREHQGHSELYDILKEAAAFYERRLRESETAIAYLKSRGLSGAIVKDYGLGYAPDGWEALTGALGTSRERCGLLRRAGLAKEGRRGLYDALRHRIVFPIRDTRGRVIGFGGRALGDTEPKYLNSPETPVFHKGRALYGLYETRGGGQPERMLVVEGYMDVLALRQHGVDGAVATLGTATTEAHVERLFRSRPDVVFCYDGDQAGRRAAWRALKACLGQLRDGRQARFMFLPEGQDPDDLVRAEGRAGFEARLAEARPLAEYLFAALGEEVDLETLDGRARLVSRAEPLLERLPPGTFRDMAFERLAALADTRLETLHQAADSPARERPRAPRHKRTPVRTAVSVILQRPSIAASAPEILGEESEVKGLDLLRALIEHARERPHSHTAQLLEAFRDHPAHPYLEELAGWRLDLPDAGLEQEFAEKLSLIEGQVLDQRLQTLESKQREGSLTDSEERALTELLQRKAGGARP